MGVEPEKKAPFLPQVEGLPDNPGVYLFKDKKGTILYVGKAGNLRHRVASYFKRIEEKDPKTLLLLEKVADVETIVTETEKEALLLEDTLIKTHHPRYNIKLRDDKRYPCLRLSLEEDYPTLRIVRRVKRDGALYFGPFPSATSLKETLKLIRRLFPIRICRDSKFSHRTRPCIQYEMEHCLGPCSQRVDRKTYGELVHRVRMFLEGRDRELLARLRSEMEEEAEKLNFEKAAKIRDQIAHLEKVIEKQVVVSHDFIDRDVIGLFRQEDRLGLYLLFIRSGTLLGGKGFTLSATGLPEEEVLSSFIGQYYREDRFIPKEILLSKEIPDKGLLESRLAELKGHPVSILIPQRGEKRRLVEMASENAMKFLRREMAQRMEKETLLSTLKARLHLERVPRRIEAFDLSNLQGSQAVGAMVTFEEGEPNRSRYRHFRIKTVAGVDDYGMMYEVLFRRYRRALEEHDLPDLVLLDGGRGQLNVARQVFKELGIDGIDLLSLAKEREGSDGRGSGEKVFHPRFREPILLGKHSPLLRFLDQIRDEAHRFALGHHKRVRKKEALRSSLEGISGIGRTRQRELLRYFGSLERLKEAPLEELKRVPKMTTKAAEAVFQFFHPRGPDEITS
ncbi:MAG: excinuclease ABC subunit UvrC [Desulfobacterota bacterium]|nr:excinuclease ABC subunit UvrC [Thermodesulfobacteriota bacterium]